MNTLFIRFFMVIALVFSMTAAMNAKAGTLSQSEAQKVQGQRSERIARSAELAHAMQKKTGPGPVFFRCDSDGVAVELRQA